MSVSSNISPRIITIVIIVFACAVGVASLFSTIHQFRTFKADLGETMDAAFAEMAADIEKQTTHVAGKPRTIGNPLTIMQRLFPDIDALRNKDDTDFDVRKLKRIYEYSVLLNHELERVTVQRDTACAEADKNDGANELLKMMMLQEGDCGGYTQRKQHLIAAIDYVDTLEAAAISEGATLRDNGGYKKIDYSTVISHPAFLTYFENADQKRTYKHETFRQVDINQFVEKTSSAHEKQPTKFVAADVLRVRSEPTTSSEIISYVRYPASVKLLSNVSSEGWVEIMVENAGYSLPRSRGFVMDKFLSNKLQSLSDDDNRFHILNSKNPKIKLQLAERAYARNMSKANAVQLAGVQAENNSSDKAMKTMMSVEPDAPAHLFYCRNGAAIWLENGPYSSDAYEKYDLGNERHEDLLENHRLSYQGYPWFQGGVDNVDNERDIAKPGASVWPYQSSVVKHWQEPGNDVGYNYYELNVSAICQKNPEVKFHATTPISALRFIEEPISNQVLNEMNPWPGKEVLDIRLHTLVDEGLAVFSGSVLVDSGGERIYNSTSAMLEGKRIVSFVDLHTGEPIGKAGHISEYGTNYIKEVHALKRHINGDVRLVVEYIDDDGGSSDGTFMNHLRYFDGELSFLNQTPVEMSVPEGTDCVYPACVAYR